MVLNAPCSWAISICCSNGLLSPRRGNASAHGWCFHGLVDRLGGFRRAGHGPILSAAGPALRADAAVAAPGRRRGRHAGLRSAARLPGPAAAWPIWLAGAL